jgi:hypothetical protein
MHQTKPSRRQLIQGLLAAPALKASGNLRLTENLPLSDSGPGYQMTLNVVTHGMFAVEFNKKSQRLFLLLPDMGAAHRYKAGHWDAENDLQPGVTYTLNGVIGDTHTPPQVPTFDCTEHAVVEADLQRKNPPFCTVDLPFPVRVIPARTQSVANGTNPSGGAPIFQTPNPLSKQPTQLPRVLVLQYTIPLVQAPPTVGVGFWTPTVNIHIYSESPTPPDPNHLADALEALKGLYSGLENLYFTKDALTAASLVTVSDNPPAGLSYPEILSLPEISATVPQPQTPALATNFLKTKTSVQIKQKEATPTATVHSHEKQLAKFDGLPQGGVEVGNCGHLIVISNAAV